MKTGELSNLDLEGRLAAQRQILAWLLSRAIKGPDDLKALKSHLDEALPPRDHQEDPGAVPAEGFSTLVAAGIEARLLIEPFERLFSDAGRQQK